MLSPADERVEVALVPAKIACDVLPFPAPRFGRSEAEPLVVQCADDAVPEQDIEGVSYLTIVDAGEPKPNRPDKLLRRHGPARLQDPDDFRFYDALGHRHGPFAGLTPPTVFGPCSQADPTRRARLADGEAGCPRPQ